MIRSLIQCAMAVSVMLVSGTSDVEAASLDQYEGRWALTIPGGGAGWLSVTKENGYYDSSILWGGGSVVTTASTYMNADGHLVVTRIHVQKRENDKGKVIKRHTFTDTITAQVDGDVLSLSIATPARNGLGISVQQFTGKRIPDLPPAPDLSKANYGDAISLLKKNGLDGWTLLNDKKKNGWTVKNGVLVNNPVQPEGQHIRYANLRTVAEYKDFNLKLEVNVPKGGNSGIYLRGIYEVQVEDSYGKSVNSHHMGGVYSRITPSTTAEKPAGKWQTYDITLMNRHITVVLNGTTIIDNQPLLGCTGGAMTSDEFKPGPLYLQGDHSGASYRKIILTPINHQ